MPSSFLSSLVDIAMTPTGDLTVGPDGDFAFATQGDAVEQSILFRLKTVRGDWRLAPSCGASLENFFGAPSSPQTGAAIENEVRYALTHDGFISESDLTVRVTPVNNNEVAVLVRVNLAGEPVVLISGLDLREGQIVLL